MKFAFLTVSYSGQFYDGRALTLPEQIRKARELGFDGISIETKRPVASPLDLTKQHRQEIRAVAAAEGIELCAVESMSNFASPLMEERENNLAMMRLVIDLAVRPGSRSGEGVRGMARARQRRGRHRVLRVLREGQLLQAAVSGRPPQVAARRRRVTRDAPISPPSAASPWRSRTTRRCCGSATKTRSR